MKTCVYTQLHHLYCNHSYNNNKHVFREWTRLEIIFQNWPEITIDKTVGFGQITNILL